MWKMTAEVFGSTVFKKKIDNQINNVKKIISFIEKRFKTWFIKVKWICICSKGVSKNWLELQYQITRNILICMRRI